MHQIDESSPADVPRRLLRRLDDLGTALSRRTDVVALIGLGSVGVDLHRLDEHSDLDFFVIVDDGAQRGFLDSIDWLERACPVTYSFENSEHGRKALFQDGLFAEYAVFTVDELARGAFSPGRIVWQRADAPARLAAPQQPPATSPAVPSPAGPVDYHANEALTNLYVGLHRDARGEKLTATRFIQSYAVDRVITIANLIRPAADGHRDAFDLTRGVEHRLGSALPLAAMMPGYAHNRAAAAVILDWLRAHVDVHPVITAAVRDLLRAGRPER